jgi:hypothetical protein
MAGAMMDSWMLATISMWVDALDKDEALKLICDHFECENLYEAATDVNKLSADKEIACKIAKNRDQGDLKDRVRALGIAVLCGLQELKSGADPPVYVVSTSNLFQVPGVIRVNVEPAVTARLDNIEKMVQSLTKGFKTMKTAKPEQQWPNLQVAGPAHQSSQDAHHLGARSRSPSVKRPADDAQL